MNNLPMLELLQLKKFQGLLIHVLKLINNSTHFSTCCQNYLQKLQFMGVTRGFPKLVS